MKVVLFVLIISCSSWQIAVNAQESGSPPPHTPPHSSMPPSSSRPPSSNPPPPGSCPNEYCPQPGSVCRVNRCPPGMTYCCVCPPGRLGDKCEMQRQAIAQQTMRLNQEFHPSLLDSTSANFTSMETTICNFNKQIWQNGFQRRNQSIVVGCKCASMRSGSIIATLNMDMANNGSSSTTITPLSATELSQAMAQTCTGTTCGNLDQTFVNVSASVDLCASNTTQNCSQYANCAFYGGLNYTCTCKGGYRDDSSGSGFTCTRMCSTRPCGGGNCTEQTGGDVLCTNCPTGTSGQYCSGSYRVHESRAILLISFIILPFFLLKCSVH